MKRNEALKEIENLAAVLPELERQELRTQTMSGHDLKLLNKKTVSGEQIQDQGIYRVKLTEPVKINHLQEMRKIYINQRALTGHDDAWDAVLIYMANVRRIHEKQTTNGKKKKQHA